MQPDISPIDGQAAAEDVLQKLQRIREARKENEARLGKQSPSATRTAEIGGETGATAAGAVAELTLLGRSEREP